MYIVDFQYNFYTDKKYRIVIKLTIMYKVLQIILYI